jgi:outer membrane murein-binding lipoprotein Lpp
MSDAQQGITLSHGIAVGLGGAAVAVGRAVWSALTRSRNETIAVLQAENARLLATVDKLGQDKDALRDKLTEERVKSAAALTAARANPNVPNEEFEEHYPSAVKNMADLMEGKAPPKKPDTHPELAGWDPAHSTPPGMRIPPTRK